MKYEFEVEIEKFDSNLWAFHFKVPKEIHANYHKEKIKRVIVSINNHPHIHSGFMPAGDGVYFIMLSKDIMKKHKLALGEKVTVSIQKDESKYGMPISEEMEELLYQDPEGAEFFEQLTPGKIRSLLHYVNKMKSSDKRIEKSIIILSHLKANNGTLDWKMLNQAFKDGIQF